LAGVFITFEGIDGSGKSTHLSLVGNALKQRGVKVLTTREPGGASLGNRLRAALLDAREEVDPLAELLVFAADRAQHVRTVLLPALDSGHVVLSDRYADATVAYQGAGRGFEPEIIDEIVNLATGGLKPNLTLIFDIPVQTGIARTSRRLDGVFNEARLDKEDEAFHTRVREAYMEMASAEPRRFRVIDAAGPKEETHKRVLGIVLPFLELTDRR
jgi:dTMP kinase